MILVWGIVEELVVLGVRCGFPFRWRVAQFGGGVQEVEVACSIEVSIWQIVS